MRPTGDTPVYRPDLGVLIMEYLAGAQAGYIGTQILPPYPVADESGTFPVVPAEAILKTPDTRRTKRSAYNRSSWEYEEGKYSCSEHGHEEPIDDSERKLLDRRMPGAADRVAAIRGSRIIAASQEIRIADKIFNESNFTANAVATAWDVLASAKPISDVNDGKSAFRKQCGMLPDALVIAYATFQALKNCESIVERLKYTFPGIDINKMTSSQLAAVFDVPMVLIGNAVHDIADKGQSRTIADIWDSKYAALVKIGSGLDLAEPCLGRTFIYETDTPDSPIVETYREEQIRSDVYRVRHAVDECLIRSYDKNGAVKSDIAASCCYLFKGIATPPAP